MNALIELLKFLNTKKKLLLMQIFILFIIIHSMLIFNKETIFYQFIYSPF